MAAIKTMNVSIATGIEPVNALAKYTFNKNNKLHRFCLYLYDSIMAAEGRCNKIDELFLLVVWLDC